MKENAIISLADSNYFELLNELVDSIKSFDQSKNIAICIMDAGLQKDQIEILEEIFNRRINEWERFEPQEWSKGNNKLLNYAGTFTSERFVW